MLKKLLAILLSVIMVFGCAVTAFADDPPASTLLEEGEMGEEGDNAKYTIVRNGDEIVLTITGSGRLRDEPDWGEYTDKITEVIVGEGIVHLSTACFAGFSNLTEITIPESVIEIGGYVFDGCLKLEQIRLPNTMWWIWDHAFLNSGIKQIVIPESVGYIGGDVGGETFLDCKSLETIEFLGSDLDINENVFSGIPDTTIIKAPARSKVNDVAYTLGLSFEATDATIKPAESIEADWTPSFVDTLETHNTLSAFVYPNNTTELSIKWISSDSEAVTIDDYSHIYYSEETPFTSVDFITKKIKNTTLTAYTEDGNTELGTYTLKRPVVNEDDIQIIDHPETLYTKGADDTSFRFEASVSLPSPTNKYEMFWADDCVWTIENPALAEIQSQGMSISYVKGEVDTSCTIKPISVGTTNLILQVGESEPKKIPVKIEQNELTGISVWKLPSKVIYNLDEELSMSGGQLKTEYKYGQPGYVEITSDMVTGFDNTKLGKQTLTVTYQGETTTFDVEVVEEETEKKAKSIEILSEPTQKEYNTGEALVPDGGKLKVTFEDGTTAEVAITKDMLSGYDANKIGKQTITVTYQDKTATFEVEVKEAEKPEDLPFSDVATKPGDWVYDSVKYVYDHKIMTGMRPDYFGVSETLSRAHFATIIYRIAGEPPVASKQVFPDVPITEKTKWYADAVAWANANKIILGYLNGNFGPADPITREQLAVMLYRYAEYMKYDLSKKADFSTYPDADQVSGWAKDAMQWAVGNGIITGEGGKYLNPTGLSDRAECATMVQRFMEKFVSEA